jgi:hypothetical protein
MQGAKNGKFRDFISSLQSDFCLVNSWGYYNRDGLQMVSNE